MAMTVVREGFREIGRKFQRLSLNRQIKAAGRTHASALRSLGKRAMEAGVTGAASNDLMSRFNESQTKGGQLQSQLDAADETRKQLEQQRDADAARFATLEKEVLDKKNPLDAELSTQQRAAAESQQQIQTAQRRQAQLRSEQQSLQQALSRPATGTATPVNREQTEARLAALAAEHHQLEASQGKFADAGSAATREVERLKAEIAPLQDNLNRIRAERKQASDRSKEALADVRRQSDKLRGEQAAVSRQRDSQFEELGGAIAAAGIAYSELAAEQGAVAAAAQAQAALQGRHDGLLQQSRDMPAGTMQKFSGLMAAALLAVGGAAYAANQASQSFRQAQPPTPVEGDCRMTYNQKRPPVQADPGGPYRVERAGTVVLDGSRSKGKCLTYTWTFAAAPKDALDPRHHSSDQQDEAVFGEVATLACPEGTMGNPGAQKTGPTAPTKFLCSLTVRLTVTDGSSTDSKTVLVTVTPRRGWQTSVDSAQPETYDGPGSLIRAQPGQLQTDLLFGKNICAIDSNPGHALHAGRSWQGEGYTVTSLRDSNGPFDNWVYVAGSTLRIKRRVQINPNLAPASAISTTNVKRGYADINVLRNAVIAHERLHGTLIFEKLARIQKEDNDPAKMIEALSTSNQDTTRLASYADMAIGQIETHLYPEQDSPEYIQNHVEIKSRLMRQYNRGGKILLPDGNGNYGEFQILSFATMGENGGT
jgi:hypothetical protein